MYRACMAKPARGTERRQVPCSQAFVQRKGSLPAPASSMQHYTTPPHLTYSEAPPTSLCAGYGCCSLLYKPRCIVFYFVHERRSCSARRFRCLRVRAGAVVFSTSTFQIRCCTASSSRRRFHLTLSYYILPIDGAYNCETSVTVAITLAVTQ